MPIRERLAPFLLLLPLCACGNPGLPLPPSLKLPEPAADLGADRVADTVRLHWTMSRRSTDRLLLKGDQRAVICRAAESAPCQRIGELLVEAGKPASFQDALPPALTSGEPRLLRYELRLQNRRHQDAGAAASAFAMAGLPPPAVARASATMSAAGIAVRWEATRPAFSEEKSLGDAPGVHRLVRLERERVLQAGQSAAPAKGETEAGVPQALTQTLESGERAPTGSRSAWTPSETVDRQAVLNRSYRYRVTLVEQVVLQGHTLEAAGAGGQTGIVVARDVYPPAVPAGLAAVANVEGGTQGAIDLAWSADADPDTAGYVVYRRMAGSAAAPERVSGFKSGAGLLPSPTWSDTDVKKGVRYAYSVSAVDASGNESARSPEVTEGLPE